MLYGVNGEGMGHATRSQVVIESLLTAEHDVRVVASQAAFRYLKDRLPFVDEIFGPSFAMEEGEIRRWATVRQNLKLAPRSCPTPSRTGSRVVDEWQPDVVITDFEPLAGIYARLSRTAARLRRQHQHDRSLQARRGDHRRPSTATSSWRAR